MKSVILYGPPGVGKSTLAALLSRQGFQPIPLAKVGSPGEEYAHWSMTQFEDAHNAGDIVWFHERYGSIYALSRRLLQTRHGRLGVIQLGVREAIDALSQTEPHQWQTIQLICPRDEVRERLLKRDPTQVDARLAVYDQTSRLEGVPTFDTSILKPEELRTAVSSAP